MATIIRFIIRIYFLSPHAFISRRNLPRVAPRKGLTSSPFTSSSSFAFRSTSLNLPPYRRVRIVALGPSFLIDDLNFRIYFDSRLRFVRSCPRAIRFILALSFFLSFSWEPSHPRYYRGSPAGGSRSPFCFAKMVGEEGCEGRRRAEGMILKYLSPCINLKAAGAHT